MDICIYVYLYICIYVHMYICKYVNMYTCTYLHIYTNIYICIHTMEMGISWKHTQMGTDIWKWVNHYNGITKGCWTLLKYAMFSILRMAQAANRFTFFWVLNCSTFCGGLVDILFFGAFVGYRNDYESMTIKPSKANAVGGFKSRARPWRCDQTNLGWCFHMAVS